MCVLLEKCVDLITVKLGYQCLQLIGVSWEGSAGKANPLQMRSVAKLSVERKGAPVGCDPRKLERKLCNSALAIGNNIAAVTTYRSKNSWASFSGKGLYECLPRQKTNQGGMRKRDARRKI